MDTHYRKIDLQSPQDLTYLLTNITRSATEKLDQAFPPTAALDEEDAFRAKVERLVYQYIHSTLTLALPSLSINGLDASPALLAPLAHATSTALASLAPSNPDAEPVYEPYDAALAERLRALYASLEAETMRVAELRREAPGRAVGVWVEQLGRPVEGPGGENESVAREEKVLLGPGFDGRGGEVERVFARAVGGLEALRGVTEGVARGERALRAAREVERI